MVHQKANSKCSAEKPSLCISSNLHFQHLQCLVMFRVEGCGRGAGAHHALDTAHWQGLDRCCVVWRKPWRDRTGTGLDHGPWMLPMCYTLWRPLATSGDPGDLW